MKKLLLMGLLALFMASCSNGTQVEHNKIHQLEHQIEELEEVDHELDEIKEEGDSIETLLNDLEN